MKTFISFFLLLSPFFFYGQPKEINETPKQYLEHITNTWDVDPNKVVYISDKTSLEDLSSIMHNSVLSFVKGENSTSAEILDGKRIVDPNACGLALNNLELENVLKHLKEGNDYTAINLKRLVDNGNFTFSDKLTTVLIYSKKLDALVADYFHVLKDFSEKDVDYVLVIFDNEITEQIPGAIKNK